MICSTIALEVCAFYLIFKIFAANRVLLFYGAHLGELIASTRKLHARPTNERVHDPRRFLTCRTFLERRVFSCLGVYYPEFYPVYSPEYYPKVPRWSSGRLSNAPQSIIAEHYHFEMVRQSAPPYLFQPIPRLGST